jgi:hypothetical protein
MQLWRNIAICVQNPWNWETFLEISASIMKSVSHFGNDFTQIQSE